MCSVGWNPAGTRIVSGSGDRTLRIWDAQAGESLRILEGHEYAVASVAWNPSGTRIASGSGDRTLRIWAARTGRSVHTLTGHGDSVSSVAWNPSGTRIASGSNDRTLRIWDRDVEEALPLWRATSRRQEAARQGRKAGRVVSALFEEHVLLEPVLAALDADPSLPEDLREVARRLADSRGDPAAGELNERAWPLVDPNRTEKDTDVELALRLARAGVRLAPKDWAVRGTLAWALHETGHRAEAITACEKAVELAPRPRETVYRSYLDRLRRGKGVPETVATAVTSAAESSTDR